MRLTDFDNVWKEYSPSLREKFRGLLERLNIIYPFQGMGEVILNYDYILIFRSRERPVLVDSFHVPKYSTRVVHESSSSILCCCILE